MGDEVIRRELTVREGRRYRLSDITESQRKLYALELFQFANITPRLPEDRSPDVPVVVTVAEGKHPQAAARARVRFGREGAWRA